MNERLVGRRGIDQLSDAGRWGPDDRRGRLNLITPGVRLAAIAIPTRGVVVSIGLDLVTHASRQSPPSAVHAMSSLGPSEVSTQDILWLSPHGFEMTHLDALGHASLDGHVYGGYSVDEAFTTRGLTRGGIDAASDGILTRGVLLDVAEARGVPHFAQGAAIDAIDLDRAESIAGIEIRSGDAVFVRAGIASRVASGEEDSIHSREGLSLDALEWLFRRQVSVYAGDCIERLPSELPDVPMPLHQIGMTQMGLWILDNPDVEALAAACARFQRHDFLLVIAPLRLPGGTASAVNPLAVF